MKHLLLTTLAPVLLALGFNAMAAPEEAPEDAMLKREIQAISQKIADTQATVKQRIANQQDPEESLGRQYAELQQLCAGKFKELEEDQRRYSKAEARTQVIGNLLALVGSVMVYAPGKTFLVGLGLSSGNSGTVSSTITQFFSTRSTENEQTLLVLRTKLNEVFDRYDLIDPESDKRGIRRAAILARGTNVCLKLATATTTLPRSGESTPGTSTGSVEPSPTPPMGTASAPS